MSADGEAVVIGDALAGERAAQSHAYQRVSGAMPNDRSGGRCAHRASMGPQAPYLLNETRRVVLR